MSPTKEELILRELRAIRNLLETLSARADAKNQPTTTSIFQNIKGLDTTKGVK